MENFDLFRRLKAPTRFCVEVTARCQNNCRHCFNYWRERCSVHGFNYWRTPVSAQEIFGCEDMSLATAEIVVRKAAAAEVFELVISGGEPFLNYPVTARIVEIARETGLLYSINSNLAAVDEEKAAWLAEMRIPVLTSLLGPNAEVHDAVTGAPGSFAATVRGIKLCRAAGVLPAVNMVLTRLNHRFVRETCTFAAEELKVRRLSVTKGLQPVSCTDFSEQEITGPEMAQCFNDALWARGEYGLEVSTSNVVPLCSLDGVEDPFAYSGGPCPCGISQMVIGCDGTVRPCTLFDVVEGNLVTEDLLEIWERMRHWGNAEAMPPECRKCELLTRCGGGCRYLGWLKDCAGGYRDTRMDETKVPQLTKLLGPERLANVQPTKRFRVKRFRIRREDFGGVVFVSDTGRRICLSAAAVGMLAALKPEEVYETAALSATHPVEFITGLAVRRLVDFLPDNGSAEALALERDLVCA